MEFIVHDLSYSSPRVRVCMAVDPKPFANLSVYRDQGCANMKFLPDTDIQYFYNLKSDT